MSEAKEEMATDDEDLWMRPVTPKRHNVVALVLAGLLPPAKLPKILQVTNKMIV